MARMAKRRPAVSALSLVALGLRLRVARQIAGLSQDELAKEIGLLRRAVMKWESGTTGEPGVFGIARAADRLGVSVDWLVSGKGNGPNIGKAALRSLIADIENRLAAKA